MWKFVMHFKDKNKCENVKDQIDEEWKRFFLVILYMIEGNCIYEQRPNETLTTEVQSEINII